ncbi:HlyD family secretion protein [Desulfotomaculum arcticum]|uniref:HlyD family secretion protein n=1 Tax=Desulfotruncus arcticus DSM 17038 TaxID=1121424 RepID=A0A1I2U745_9FIRM|nr:efflux RND transporter periplasmic adaptor subunit [Desulfotruncus arcticus]SFG72908.1 HlyD family secretion protein [Desulfotomaculum arcticum] [Desulfotruncus arcticus DSM 17038]
MLQFLKQKITKISKKKLLAGVLILGLVVSVVAVNIIKNRKPTGIPVKTAKVEQQHLQDNVFATGRVRLVEKQEFYSYEETTVKKINVNPGETVHKGQVLGILDAGDLEDKLSNAKASYAVQQSNLEDALNPRPEEIAKLRADYNKAGADYQNAQKNYERTKRLHDQDAVSAQELETAELDLIAKETAYKNAGASLKIKESGPTGPELASLEAQVEQARIQTELAQRDLDRNTLTAEMDGVVIAVEVADGDHIDPGTRLITIGNTDKVEVTAGVSEADSGRLKMGQKVQVSAAALPDRVYTGELRSVSPGALVESGNQGSQIEVPVIVSITGDSEGLRLGYTVDLTITTVDVEKALVVPYEAVVEKGGQRYVYVVENGTAGERKVETGLDTELFTEIKSGLKEGETVIVGPAGNLKDGDKISELNNVPAAGGNK